jgi:putative membrane protein
VSNAIYGRRTVQFSTANPRKKVTIKTMKRILFFIVLLILVVFTISFTLLNTQMVTIKYYFVQWDTDLMKVILFSVCLGAALGFMATISMVFRLKHELSKKKKEVKHIEKEVANLRALPLKDKH